MHLGAVVYRAQPIALGGRFRANLEGLWLVEWLYCYREIQVLLCEHYMSFLDRSDRENYEDE